MKGETCTMCQITRKGSIAWEKGHRERVIRLEDDADRITGKEVSEYLGFPFQRNEIKLSKLPKRIDPKYILQLIKARADQIRTYRKREKTEPTFIEFMTKRNKKTLRKMKIL